MEGLVAPTLAGMVGTPLLGNILGKAGEVAKEVFGTTDAAQIQLQVDQDKNKLEGFKARLNAATQEEQCSLRTRNRLEPRRWNSRRSTLRSPRVRRSCQLSSRSHRGDPNLGKFDAVILKSFVEVPEDLQAAGGAWRGAKGELGPAAIDRDWPHQVALSARGSPGGKHRRLNDFCKLSCNTTSIGGWTGSNRRATHRVAPSCTTLKNRP